MCISLSISFQICSCHRCYSWAKLLIQDVLRARRRHGFDVCLSLQIRQNNLDLGQVERDHILSMPLRIAVFHLRYFHKEVVPIDSARNRTTSPHPRAGKLETSAMMTVLHVKRQRARTRLFKDGLSPLRTLRRGFIVPTKPK